MRKMAFVRRIKEANTVECRRQNRWAVNESFIYFGEIPNMPGHGVFYSDRLEKFYVGLHIDEFEEIPEDEV